MFSGDAAVAAMLKKQNSFMFDDVVVPEELVAELHPLPDEVMDEFEGILNRNQAAKILQPKSHEEEVIVPVEAVAELPVKKKKDLSEEVIVPVEAVAELPVKKKKDLPEEEKKPNKKKVQFTLPEEAELKKKKHGSKEKDKPTPKEVPETKKKEAEKKKKEEDPPAKKFRPLMNVVKDQFPVFIPSAHPFVLISICQRCLCEANNKIKMSSCGKEYITFVMCHDCVQKNNTLRAIFK